MTCVRCGATESGRWVTRPDGNICNNCRSKEYRASKKAQTGGEPVAALVLDGQVAEVAESGQQLIEHMRPYIEVTTDPPEAIVKLCGGQEVVVGVTPCSCATDGEDGPDQAPCDGCDGYPAPPEATKPGGDGVFEFEHTCTDGQNGGGDGECLACGERDCPQGEPMHYHHDGCPSCDMPAPGGECPVCRDVPPAEPAPPQTTDERLQRLKDRVAQLLKAPDELWYCPKCKTHKAPYLFGMRMMDGKERRQSNCTECRGLAARASHKKKATTAR